MQTENLALLSLLADIRKAAGDAEGKLMQDDLVTSISALRATSDRAEFMLKRWGGACHCGDGRWLHRACCCDTAVHG